MRAAFSLSLTTKRANSGCVMLIGSARCFARQSPVRELVCYFVFLVGLGTVSIVKLSALVIFFALNFEYV